MAVEVLAEEDGARVVALTTPLTDEDGRELRAGDRVRVTGELFTARDAAHRRLAELEAVSEPWPFPAAGSILYYVGPTPERPGHVIGSAGPTTASRMDPHLAMTLEHGVRATIGKGGRGPGAKATIAEHGAPYLAAVGGLGAVLARAITRSEVVAFEDLGTEAIRRLEVVDFPAVVVYDAYGGDLYAEAKAAWHDQAGDGDGDGDSAGEAATATPEG